MVTHFDAGKHGYVLNYTINSLCSFEDRFQRDISDVISHPTFNNIRGAIWAGLIDQHPNLSLEETGRIIDEYLNEGERSLGDVLRLCAEALTNSGFFQKAGKGPAAKKTKQGK